MNRTWNDNNEAERGPAADDVDATLHVVASLPAPQGLEDRVHETLRSATRTARILEWPGRFVTDSAWVRSAAAAAIAFVVVGGGWGVYSRVQTAKVIEMPSHIASPDRGFSNAGAKRTPETVQGPIIHHPETGRQGTSGSPQIVEMPAKQAEKDSKKKSDAPLVK